MKKISLLILLAFLLFTFAVTAQTTSNSPGSLGTQTTQGAGATSQSSPANGNIVEGCVVQVEKDYYLQPVSGGNRMRLKGSHDFAADVGHSVRAEGIAGAPGVPLGKDQSKDNSVSSTGAKNNPDSPPVPSSSTGPDTQDFVVSKITTVSQTCPANSSNSPSGGSLNTPH